MLRNQYERGYRQGDAQDHEEEEKADEHPVGCGLTAPHLHRMHDVSLQQLVIAAVGFEDDVEEIADPWDRSRERFNSHVGEHAGDRDARDAKLNGASDDVERNQRIEDVAEAGDESGDSGQAEAKAARKDESVIEPSRHSFDVGDPSIDPRSGEVRWNESAAPIFRMFVRSHDIRHTTNVTATRLPIIRNLSGAPLLS